MAFWWVNHKQTRDHEVSGGYLWSPRRNANKAFNQTYENMRLAQPGDIVFSYANGQIGAIGQVTEAAAGSPKPTEFGSVGDYWSDDGWLVEVDFQPVGKALVPAQHIDAISHMLPAKHSPIQKNGHGNQGCYLAGISDALGHMLLALMDSKAGVELALEPMFLEDSGQKHAVIDDLRLINNDATIPETQRIQLAKARIGQGLFRTRVILLDGACRVTGVSDRRLLIASHIKPWKVATNPERISGHNGVLLSPHVDALFDSHLLTFQDDGRLRVHASLPRDVLDRWAIDPDKKTQAFRPEQRVFLEHHRATFAAKAA